MMTKLWHYWAKALGEKAFPETSEADKVAIVRTGIVMVYLLTNIILVINVIHHWSTPVVGGDLQRINVQIIIQP